MNAALLVPEAVTPSKVFTVFPPTRFGWYARNGYPETVVGFSAVRLVKSPVFLTVDPIASGETQVAPSN